MSPRRGTTLFAAIDTGGTFTDVVVSGITEAGQVLAAVFKLPSTADDPSRAVLEGLRVAVEKLEQTTEQLDRVTHGSTVATNALLEQRHGRAAFVTTAGFEDVLHLGRQHRPVLYDLEVEAFGSPISREFCVGFDERCDCDGQPLVAPSETALTAVTRRLGELGVEAVAVSLLHAYASPDHEQALGAAIREALPGVHLTLSHRLLPEIREYERGMACAINAVVAPAMVNYLTSLDEALTENGSCVVRIMGSGGGSLTVAQACAEPVRTVLSGPAGGVVGALAAARREGLSDIITFDMGGTSTDVALCQGAPGRTNQAELGGLPVHLPAIDIHTVGAGGGSIAWIDRGGALRVGPQSAGADPGPACYGRQRGPDWLCAVTDAAVVLDLVPRRGFLNGEFPLDQQAARAAVRSVASRLGMSVEETARGIQRIAAATMERAIRRISVERGYDPRRFALVTFGGAGGFFACDLAESLGIETVLIPVAPGLLSAVGMLESDALVERSLAVMTRAEADEAGVYPQLPFLPVVAETLEHLRTVVTTDLAEQGIELEATTLIAELDVRYVGQSFELVVEATEDAAARFAQAHQQLYGTTSPGRPLEIVAARVRGTGSLATPPKTSPSPSPDGPRHLDTTFLQRDDLRPLDRFVGPCLVGEYSSTTVVPSGWSGRVTSSGAIVLEVDVS